MKSQGLKRERHGGCVYAFHIRDSHNGRVLGGSNRDCRVSTASNGNDSAKCLMGMVQGRRNRLFEVVLPRREKQGRYVYA